MVTSIIQSIFSCLLTFLADVMKKNCLFSTPDMPVVPPVFELRHGPDFGFRQFAYQRGLCCHRQGRLLINPMGSFSHVEVFKMCLMVKMIPNISKINDLEYVDV
jgi:hypothetical protein